MEEDDGPYLDGEGEEDDSINESEAETDILDSSSRSSPAKPDTIMRESNSASAPPRHHTNQSASPVHHASKPPLASGPSDFSSTRRNLSSVPPRTRSESPDRSHRRSNSYQSTLSPRHKPLRQLRSRQSREPPSSLKNHHRAPSEYLTMPSISSDKMPSKGPYGRSELWDACKRGDEPRVKELLAEYPEDAELGDNANIRPLQAASLDGHVGVVSLLLEANCDPNVWNKPGDTPLIEAITNGHVEIVNMLLNAGANPWQKNGNYEMPKDLVKTSTETRDASRKEMEKALLAAADARIKSGGAADHLPVKPNVEKPVHFEGFSVKVLEKYCGLGIMAEVHYQLDTRVKPNNACALAAAMGGHVNVLRRLQREGLDLDPAPDNEGNTPMLVAIGRGNLHVIRFLVDSEGFNLERRFKGRLYHQIAYARKGPDMSTECRILRSEERSAHQALPSSSGPTDGVKDLGLASVLAEDRLGKVDVGRGSHTGDPSKLMFLDDSSELKNIALTLSYAENKRKRLHTKAEENREQQAKEDAAKDAEAKSAAEQYIADAERQMRERRDYLNSLPRVISRALSAGLHLPPTITNLTEKQWKKSLRSWLPIEVIKRVEIQPDCPPDNRDDLYIHNIVAAIHLHHETLTAYKEAGHSTLPMTRDQHKKYIDGGVGTADLAWDNSWEKGSAVDRQYATDTLGFEFIEYEMIGTTTGKTAFKIKNKALYEIEARKQIFEIADGQFYFIELNRFIQLTAACEWLRNFRFESEKRLQWLKSEERTPALCPRWENGRVLSYVSFA